MKLPQILLVIDDAIVIFIVTFYGIRFHQTDPSLFTRLPYTLLPFLASWVLTAAILQLYSHTHWRRRPCAVAWNSIGPHLCRRHGGSYLGRHSYFTQRLHPGFRKSLVGLGSWMKKN